MADLKGKLVNDQDNKTVGESLKSTVGKSNFDVGFQNLTTTVLSEQVFHDPPTETEVVGLQDNLNNTNSKVDAIINALQLLGINIMGDGEQNKL